MSEKQPLILKVGIIEYLVMPFGLTNVPTVFQWLVNDVLRHLLNSSVFLYLDAILKFFMSKPEHVLYIKFSKGF